jgi:hypothetical protein
MNSVSEQLWSSQSITNKTIDNFIIQRYEDHKKRLLIRHKTVVSS